MPRMAPEEDRAGGGPSPVTPDPRRPPYTFAVVGLLFVGALATAATSPVAIELAHLVMGSVRSFTGVAAPADGVRPGSVIVRLLCYGFVAAGFATMLAQRDARPTRARLGLARPRLGPGAWVGIAGTYVGLQLLLAGLYPVLWGSDGLAAFLQMPVEWWAATFALVAALRWEGLVLFLVLGFAAGACGELLHRGYVQRGLEELLPPRAAVGLAAVIALIGAHEPRNAASALPMSLLLGWLAWRANSVHPALVLGALHQAAMFACAAAFLALAGPVRQSANLPLSAALAAAGALLLFASLRVLDRRLPDRRRADTLAAPAPPS